MATGKSMGEERSGGKRMGDERSADGRARAAKGGQNASPKAAKGIAKSASKRRNP
jgi:hypothetical protein